MKQKLPVDAQLLSCAHKELAIKKLVEQMDTFEKQYSESMTKLSDNMEKLTNSISEGFSVLKHFMIPLPPAPYAYQGNHQFPPMYSQCIVIHCKVSKSFLYTFGSSLSILG